MSRQPLTITEWLEDMRRFGGRDADRATELLTSLEAMAAMDQDHTELSKRVHELAVGAGLVDPGDWDTDPIPLIEMFLPDACG